MLAITHIIVSLLLIQILTLDRNDAFIALMFGVFIDLDHLFGLEGYVRTNGVAGLFDFHSLTNPGGQWKSLLHNPVALAVVGPLSIGWRWAIPFLFWSVHIAMDYAEENILGNFSAMEGVLAALAGIALVSIRFREFSELTPGTAMQYLRSEWRTLRAAFTRRSARACDADA